MFMIFVDYPSMEEEIEIMKRGTGTAIGTPRTIIEIDHILYLQGVVRRMPVSDHVLRYAQKIVAATRAKSPQALDFCKKWLASRARVRAGLAEPHFSPAKAYAIVHGQGLCRLRRRGRRRAASILLRHRLHSKLHLGAKRGRLQRRHHAAHPGKIPRDR